MDIWHKFPLNSEDPYLKNKTSQNPSFSSTLLDAIYRSIDESNDDDKDDLIYYRDTMKKKHSNSLKQGSINTVSKDKKVGSENIIPRRKSVAADFGRDHSKISLDSMLLNSSSTSSDSSCGSTSVGFSSGELDSFHRPKSIRTSILTRELDIEIPSNGRDSKQKLSQSKNGNKNEGGFVKTKSRALKIYSDLKKVKQPISPGGRLATFLNSIFTNAGHVKREKLPTERAKSEQAPSTCSSASSFTRSCLSKTSSSRGKSSSVDGPKRSVRFCPVSVIVDEHCKPCGHKSLYNGNKSQQSATNVNLNLINNEDGYDLRVIEENRRVVEAAKELLRNYKINKAKEDFHMEDVIKNKLSYEEEEDDDNDAISCASSDLFELDNLSAIGIERYREELPVYETTHFHTNHKYYC